ncbi:hypothetical protein FH968_19970 [Buttiauxella sp. B2]|nr:hypothetical protein [Buttiauxella sp. B2]TNV16132.1 hypothetical protein FH968_19970 [Buttiauxella sp. B2]
MTEKPTPEQITEARTAANLSKQEAADIFGMALRTWQQKEETGKGNRSLSVGEWNYLLLLAGKHPDYSLVAKK